MDYKKETKEIYNKYPEYFDEKFGTYSNEIIKEELNEVVLRFPNNAKILDLGSGPGNHALFFKNKGFDVLCLDISEKMLEKCMEKGLRTIKMDFEKLDFPENRFDVVWAYTSLLHMPKKNMPCVLKKIRNILSVKGIFMLSMKEGESEGFTRFTEGGKRWFSCYTDKEIRNLLSEDFKIIKHWRVPISDKKCFLDYLCVKK